MFARSRLAFIAEVHAAAEHDEVQPWQRKALR
jgi:hypothetical protein